MCQTCSPLFSCSTGTLVVQASQETVYPSALQEMTGFGERGRPWPMTPAYTGHSSTSALPVALLHTHTHAAGLLAALLVLAARFHTPATISAPPTRQSTPTPTSSRVHDYSQFCSRLGKSSCSLVTQVSCPTRSLSPLTPPIIQRSSPSGNHSVWQQQLIH